MKGKNEVGYVLTETCWKYGKGEILQYDIVKGITLYYCQYQTKENYVRKPLSSESHHYLEIVYNQSGIHQCYLQSGQCYEVGAGDLAFYQNLLKVDYLSFPFGVYDGLSIFLEYDVFDDTTHQLLDLFGISIDNILMYLNKKRFFVLSCDGYLLHLLGEIYQLKRTNDINLLKVKVIDLLLTLERLDHVIDDGYKKFSQDIVKKVRHIKQAIDEYPENHETIATLSEKYGLPQTTLKTCFKYMYGYPPYEYLMRQRVNYGVILLKETDMSIAQIAQKVGYSNPSKFSKTFKKIIGYSPTEQRKRLLGVDSTNRSC